MAFLRLPILNANLVDWIVPGPGRFKGRRSSLQPLAESKELMIPSKGTRHGTYNAAGAVWQADPGEHHPDG